MGKLRVRLTGRLQVKIASRLWVRYVVRRPVCFAHTPGLDLKTDLVAASLAYAGLDTLGDAGLHSGEANGVRLDHPPVMKNIFLSIVTSFTT